MDLITTPPGEPTVAAELRRLADLVERLADDVERLIADARLDREERELLRRLVPLLVELVGTADFAAADLLDVPRLAPLLAGWSAAEISWLLKRCSDFERVGRDRDGALWRLHPKVTARARRSPLR